MANKEEIYYKCTRCGKEYNKQELNFSKSKSDLYMSNDGYLHICKTCVNEIFDYYLRIFEGNKMKAIKRICEMFDFYYDSGIANKTAESLAQTSVILDYFKRMNFCKTGTTYMDNVISLAVKGDIIETLEDISDESKMQAQEKSIRFFGTGFSDDDYIFLQDQYDDWVARHECSTKAQEELFKQICFAQLDILHLKRRDAGSNDIAKAIKSFQDLLDSADLKPKQNKENTFSDEQTFGTLIKKWENEDPIPEPDPEWKDVDGIVRYIHIYFLGHLCRMMGIENSYSKMYDEEMDRYRVEKPEYEEDSEALFDSIFGGDKIGN